MKIMNFRFLAVKMIVFLSILILGGSVLFQPFHVESDVLTIKEFWDQFGDAIRKDDDRKLYSLIRENPKLAKGLLQFARMKQKEKSDKAAIFKEMEELLVSIFKEIGWDPSPNSKAAINEINRLVRDGDRAYSDMKYTRALELFKNALNRVLKLGGEEESTVNILIRMGDTYLGIGQFRHSFSYYKQALDLNKRLNNIESEGHILKSIGDLYAQWDHFEKALSYYKEALSIFKGLKDKDRECRVLSAISMTYCELGEYERTRVYLEQSNKIARNIGLVTIEAQNYNILAFLCSGEEQPAKAISYLEKALEIAKKMKNKKDEYAVYTYIGLMHAQKGQYKMALHYFDNVQKIGKESEDPRWKAAINSYRAFINYNLGENEKALTLFRDCLGLLEKSKYPRLLGQTYFGLGMVEAKLNRYIDAIYHYEEALKTIESVQGGLSDEELRISFIKDNRFVYNMYIELLESLHSKRPVIGYNKKAFEIFERKQGRILLEEIGESNSRHFAGIPEELLDKEAELQEQINRYQLMLLQEQAEDGQQRDKNRIDFIKKWLETAEKEQQQILDKIQMNYPEYYAIKYPQPVASREIQEKVLKPGEVVIIYNVMDTKTALWVISRNGFLSHAIPAGEKQMTELVSAFRNRVFNFSGHGPRGEIIRYKKTEVSGSPGNRLYDLLFPEKVRAFITGAGTLYIVPTKSLYLLPFEALQSRQHSGQNRYLIQDHSLVYLSSSSLLKIIREVRANRKKEPLYPFLAFANPVYKNAADTSDRGIHLRSLRTKAYLSILRKEFSPLPETEEEVKEINKIFNPPESSRPLQLREAASRKNLLKMNLSGMLSDYKYIVFACHGILPGETNRLVQPALILSNPQEDGYLKMEDIFTLKLNADLVSLTACNTGGGKIVNGEGIMGLTRAFLYAGTAAVAVTLWAVESHSIKTLNVGFFQYLKQGLSNAEALRTIKIEMIRGKKGKQFQHPYYWAPLVIYGDGG